MSNWKVLRRREFLQLSALAGGAVALAACAPTPPATPTRAPAAPTPAAVAATAAPAAAASAPASPQVTKPPAAPTAAAAAAPSAPASPQVAKAPAVATPAERIGKHLIGKMEGPETITDPAQYPKTFKEAPALADLVKAGKLPPVQERIGQDPLVLKPVHAIGKYGGNARRGFTGPGDRPNGPRFAGNDTVVHWDYTGTKTVPLLVKGWEFGDGGRTITFFLRRGMKWSDGQPLTADDFLFWFQDMYQNKELMPAPSLLLSTRNGPGVLEKVDTYTIRWKFPDPYYVFPITHMGSTGIGGHAFNGYSAAGYGGVAPAHYLKQFHPKYTPKEELDKRGKEAKFDNWVLMMQFKNDWTRNTELPCLTPWKLTSPATTPNYVFERNPYCFMVDTEGNQLPYLDKVVLTLGENLEVINLRAIAGEYDYQDRHTDLAKLPVFLENQAKAGYKVYLDPSLSGADVALHLNHSYDADPEIARLLTNRDFRRALSLGIEREQLNEIFWLGLGVPGSIAPDDNSIYGPGPDYRTLWSTYDPKKANEMLDALGLNKKDADGYRLRSDGKGRLRLEIETYLGLVQFTQICEMIREQWKKIGIEASVKEMERSLAEKRRDANEHQIHVANMWASEHLYAERPWSTFPIDKTAPMGPFHGLWFVTGGQKGKEPPPRMKEVLDLYIQALSAPDKEHVELTKKLWRIIVEEQWSLGTVGLSPALMGLRVAKTGMGNVPARMFNGSQTLHPKQSKPETYFWK